MFRSGEEREKFGLRTPGEKKKEKRVKITWNSSMPYSSRGGGRREEGGKKKTHVPIHRHQNNVF